MTSNYSTQQETRVVGNNYASDSNSGFKQEVKGIFEGYMQNGINLNTPDFQSLISSPLNRQQFEGALMESFQNDPMMTNASCANEPFYNNYADRCGQLLDNSLTTIAQESVMQGYRPICAYNPFFLKKQWVDCVWKDVLMTEVPAQPVINYAFERRFIKTADGKRYEIPDVFYDDATMKTLNDAATGLAFKADKEISLPKKNLDILTADYFPGIVVTDRSEMLTQDLAITAVHFKGITTGESGNQTTTGDKWVACNIKADVTNRAWLENTVSDGGDGDAEKTDSLVGRVNFEDGTISIFSTTDEIDKVKMSGKLAGRFNDRGLDVKREVTHLQYTMPESGPRLNTAITIEEAADAMALQKVDLIADNVDMMGRTLGELEDAEIRSFVGNSWNAQQSASKGPFGYQNTMTVAGSFDALPYEGYTGNISQWMKDSREYFERIVNDLKQKIKVTDCVVVAVANPKIVRFMQDGIDWVFSDDTQVSGVKLSYNFGIYTTAQDRVHVISSQYVPENNGFMFFVIPTSKELITFKHFKYNMVVDRGYRNPVHNNTPNVMATHRTLTLEVLPVQGRLTINGRSFQSPTTLKR